MRDAELGVSATHLDWTMVPYVQKSFKKHFQDAVKYLGMPIPEDYLASSTQQCKYEHQLEQISDTTSINDNFYTMAPAIWYQYAMDMTKKEVYQAVEGMYHNLN